MLETRGSSALIRSSLACLLVGLCACAADTLGEDEKPNSGATKRKPASDTNVEAVTGDIAIVAALDSVVPNETEDNTTVLIFQEQRDLTLSRPLGYDVQLPVGAAQPAVAQGEVPAGTKVNVYFVHFDPVGRASKRFSASIVFADTILGVAFRMKTLDAGDEIVGRDDVNYPKPGSASERGLEYPGADKLTFDADRRTLDIDLSTSTSSDQMRVITTAEPN